MVMTEKPECGGNTALFNTFVYEPVTICLNLW
jgi:hypothetical protein